MSAVRQISISSFRRVLSSHLRLQEAWPREHVGQNALTTDDLSERGPNQIIRRRISRILGDRLNY